MRLLAVLPFTALTFVCWGLYGPLLHHGKHDMGDSSILQFICVGIAYFLIAVVVPIAVLNTRGEKGHWTMGGATWSLWAGALGAIGALGVIFALTSGGSPVYVMPLVFGLAPVVNTFVSMWMSRTFKDAGKIFYTGVLLVAVGGAGVMYFRSDASNVASIWDLTIRQATIILGSIAIAALCWGSYGPTLHKGQAAMSGSKLRPFLCVGISYFAIAVLVPMGMLTVQQAEASWNMTGALWSLGAGAAGAVGALGIILAFNFGGRPVVIMPLVFGGAPVVNTAQYVVENGAYTTLPLLFYASLLVVVTGAVVVLVFAPRAKPAGGPPKKTTPEKSKPGKEPAHVENNAHFKKSNPLLSNESTPVDSGPSSRQTPN